MSSGFWQEVWYLLRTDQVRNIIGLVAAFAATGTLLKGVLELSKQNALKRLEAFTAVSARFRAAPKFEEIAELCARDDSALRHYRGFDKIAYANFFEELGLLVNSKMLNIEIVKLTWGPYIDLCAKSKNFWSNKYFNRKDYYWSAFFGLSRKIKRTYPDLRKVRF